MCLITAFGLVFVGLAAAQEGQKELPDDKGGAVPEKANSKGLSRRAIGAVTVAALVGGHGQLGDMLIVQQSGWTGAWETTGGAERLKIPVPLATEMMVGIEQDKPVGLNPFEAQTYNYVLAHAHDVSAEDLAKAASENRNLTQAHLLEQPVDYQGKVIHIEGVIHRLRKFDAPKALANDGIRDLYEAWIFQRYNSKPYCVVFTHPPKDMEPGEKVDYRVECDGYFFKRYAYKGPEKYLLAPLIVARDVHVPGRVMDTGDYLSAAFIPSVVAGIASVVLLGVALTVWFRRGDRAVQDRLLSLRQPPPAFSDPSFTEESPAPRE
jgi:hypothetical protein